MKKSRRLRIYDLHSWTGVSLGLYVYLVAITGCFALFADEVKTWEDPAGRLEIPSEPVPIHDPFADWVESHSAPGDNITFLSLNFPSAYEPYYSANLFKTTEDKVQVREHAHWNASTGELLAERVGGLTEWLLDFHRDLMWPEFLGGRQIGRFLVGAAGIILLLSIISGVVMHTKFFKEMFKLRIDRSIRLKWADYHKIIGVWGLPFHTMMAITGAFLGVITLVLPVLALLVFKGDQETMIDKLGFGPQAAANQPAVMLSLDSVGKMRWSDGEQRTPVNISIENWQDANATYMVSFEADDELMLAEPLAISGVTGELKEHSNVLERNFTNRTFLAISALHYGTYGNIALKLLYFILGVGLSLLSAFGLLVWLEKRRHGSKGKQNERFYRKLSCIAIAITTGLPLATAAIFHADKLMGAAEHSRVLIIGWVYFAAIAVALIWSIIRENEYQAIRELLMLTSAAAVLIPLTNYLTTNDVFVLGLFGSFKPYAWVDFACLFIGLVLAYVAVKIPRDRPAPVQELLTAK